MTPSEIPQQLIDVLDARAGKIHSRTGPVLAALAELLTLFERSLMPKEDPMDDQELAKLAQSTFHAKAALPPKGDGDIIGGWLAVVEVIRSAVLAARVVVPEEMVFVHGNDTIDRLAVDYIGQAGAGTGTGWCAPSP